MKTILLCTLILTGVLLVGCNFSSKSDSENETARERDVSDDDVNDDAENDDAESDDDLNRDDSNTNETAEASEGDSDLTNSDVDENEISEDAKKKNAILASAFETVENYPLQEDIGAELWLEAKEAIDNYASGAISDSANGASDASASPFVAYNTLYQEQVTQEGFHYLVEALYFGMTIKSEYWVKNGKCKKVEDDKVSIYDDKTYIEYVPSSKTGSTIPKTNAPSDIVQAVEGPLAQYSTLVLEQTDTQTVNGIECDVFFMGIEVMGMKGMTMFIDKQTGILVKQVMGDEETGLITAITQLDIGGFDDTIFDVPSDITLTD